MAGSQERYRISSGALFLEKNQKNEFVYFMYILYLPRYHVNVEHVLNLLLVTEIFLS